MTNSISFWLIVAIVVLIIIWWRLKRNQDSTPAGVATPDNVERSKSLPPDSSGTNVHPPRSTEPVGAAAAAAQPAGLASLAAEPETPAADTAAKAPSKPRAAAKKAPSKARVAAKKTASAPAKKAPATKAKKAAPAKPKAAARTASTKDELQRISGIGPKIDGQLKAMKITTFAQIAAWKKADMAEVNEKLKFKGRIEREEWVPQARLLAKGKEAEFARKYGSGGMKAASGQTKSGTRTRKS